MKFIVGQKVNMTQIFDDKGLVHPVTVVKTTPMTVTAVKTVESDGYNAVQFGVGSRAEKNISQAVRGQMKGASYATLKEVRLPAQAGVDASDLKVGDSVDLSGFAAGDVVSVSSTSKAKGFQGVVKRHGFGGGPRSHGQKHSEREPGSIGGAGRDGGRVAKGKRMAGRMGGDRITTKNLKIVAVKLETGEIFIQGAIAGRRGTLVEING